MFESPPTWHQTSPFYCNDRAGSDYTPRELVCVIRRVFGPGWRVALKVARCESGLDERQVTPPYNASGLLQFLPGTFAATPYRHRPILHPVWNARAARWLVAKDHGYREWTCASIVGAPR
jgi:hypothetical protein